jgi:hypothetical protein
MEARRGTGVGIKTMNSPVDDEGAGYFFLDRPRNPISDR